MFAGLLSRQQINWLSARNEHVGDHRRDLCDLHSLPQSTMSRRSSIIEDLLSHLHSKAVQVEDARADEAKKSARNDR